MMPSPDQPSSENTDKKSALGLLYLIDENPPWYICLFLGFQVKVKTML